MFSDFSIVSYSPKEDVQPAAYPDHQYARFPLPLEEQLEAARQEIALLTQETNSLKASRFGLQRLQNDAKLLTFYTGFPVSNGNTCLKMVLLGCCAKQIKCPPPTPNTGNQNPSSKEAHFGLRYFLSYTWHT